MLAVPDSHRLETGDALGLKDLDGVRLELVVAGESFVEAHNAFGLPVTHGANEFERQFTLKANQQRPARDSIERFPAKIDSLDGCRE